MKLSTKHWRTLGLVGGLLATGSHVSGCGVARLTPDAQMQKTPECRQMQDKLAADKSLTATQAAEIMQNMEKAGCGSRLPGP